jgi:hypothetical protein
MATRREFLAGAAALAGVGLGSARSYAATPAFMAAARINGHDGGAVWRDGAIEPFALPARGHALAAGPDDMVIVVGRRPGTFAALLNRSDPSKPPLLFAPAANARFTGHATFSPDRRLLVSSEIDAETMRGILVLRDPRTGAEQVHWDPQAIEPHELMFSHDGARLVAAMGGLKKDGGVSGPAPYEGGIDSAVIVLDPASGRILARYKLAPEFASLSLRHLAQAKDGRTFAVAMQDQDLSKTRPLVAVFALGGEIAPLPQPDVEDTDFRGYAGSVAISGDLVAATSPRGGVLGVWSLSRHAWIGGLGIPDACGLGAADDNGTFWVTSGFGDVLKIVVDSKGPAIAAKWSSDASFDNHLLLV